MKKCKCIKEIEDEDISKFKLDIIYNYKYGSEGNKSFPYVIYTDNNSSIQAIFKKDYFYKHFIDIQELRKQKLQKIKKIYEEK